MIRRVEDLYHSKVVCFCVGIFAAMSAWFACTERAPSGTPDRAPIESCSWL